MSEATLLHPQSARGRKLTAFVLGASLLSMISPAASQSAGNGYGSAPAQRADQTEVVGSGEQVFHIATVHLDAKTNVKGDAAHPAEPFPESAKSSGGGLIVRPPNEQGDWTVRAFVFQPSQVVVQQGDKVTLNFVGVQGPSHTIAIDGQNERITLKRGEMKSLRFVAEQPGTIRFVSVGREPTMQGSILVLRRD